MDKVTATAVSVLSPDLLVTAKHVFFKGKRAVVSFGRCSFRSYSHRNVAIPVFVEKDQRRGYVFNNEDFIVVRLKRELEGCNAFAINDSDSSLREGEQVLSVTGHQLQTLNKISRREPVLAKGKIRKGSRRIFGGRPSTTPTSTSTWEVRGVRFSLYDVRISARSAARFQMTKVASS